jgi:hypothetical protein
MIYIMGIGKGQARYLKHGLDNFDDNNVLELLL